jgi:hypothetical protein
MSGDRGSTDFEVSDQGVQDFVASIGAASLADAFPAVLLAPVWRAMLEAGVVVTPPRVAVDRAEVVVLDTNVLELRVPISTTFGQLVKSVPVVIDRLADGDIEAQVTAEAERLAGVLETADSQQHYAHGPGQKPHN